MFVDAGYLFASGGHLCHETSRRVDLTLDQPGLLEWLANEAQGHSDVGLLRTYWYDGARDGLPSESHERIAARPGVKLRLGRLNTKNQQKGVDALIYRDLMTLATERVITDAYLLSGDEDLREGVKAAQDRGVRVTLIGIPARTGYNQSKELCWEVDDRLTLDKETLSAFLKLLDRPQPDPDAQPQTTPTAAGEAFATSWLQNADAKSADDLFAEHPRIPWHIDVELLQSAESDMQVSLREDQNSRDQVRAAFWRMIEAGQSENPADK